MRKNFTHLCCRNFAKTPGKKFICPKGKKKIPAAFVKRHLVRKMTSQHTNGKSFSVWEKTSTQSSNMCKNIRPAHTVEESFRCSVCESTFSSRANLYKHLKKHTGEKPYPCNVCGRAFYVKDNLTKHIRIHTGEKPFSCNVCGKAFSRKCVMSQHVKLHTGDKPFSCTVCGMAFSSKSNMNQHLKIHTGEKPFACTFCGKTFGSRSKLSLHIRQHIGYCPYLCDVCGQKFISQNLLNKHLRTHMDEKPFSCSFCEKTFIARSSLNKHMRIHTVERPFVCVCGKTYSRKFDLTRHLQIHTEGKSPFCSVCGKEFLSSYALYRHLKTHKAETPFACDICGKKYACKQNLLKHSASHEENEMFSCSKIDFTADNDLFEHNMRNRVTVDKSRKETIGQSGNRGDYEQQCTVKEVSQDFLPNIPNQNTNLIQIDKNKKYCSPSCPCSCIVCDKTLQCQSVLAGRWRVYRSDLNSCNTSTEVSMKKMGLDINKSRFHTQTFICSVSNVSETGSSPEKFYTDVDTHDAFCEQCVWTAVSCDLCNQELPWVCLRTHLGQHVGIL